MGTETQSIVDETVKLAPSTLIMLFELDLTKLGGTILYFHNGTMADYSKVTFNGITYEPFPVITEGFETKIKGELPRPTLTFSNIGNYIGALADAYDDLVGAQVTRRRTYYNCLTSPSVPQYIPDIYYIDRMTERTKTYIRFELGTSLDVENLQLPLRQVSPSYCPWMYRGDGCRYSEDFCVAESDNTPLFSKASTGMTYEGAVGDESILVFNINSVVFIARLGGYYRCFYAQAPLDRNLVTAADRLHYAEHGLFFYRGVYDAAYVYNYHDTVWEVNSARSASTDFGISKWACQKDGVLNKAPSTNPNEWREISAWYRIEAPSEYSATTAYRMFDRVFETVAGVKTYYIAKQNFPNWDAGITWPPAPSADTNNIYWAKEQISKGLWTSGTVYAEGDAVYRNMYSQSIFRTALNASTIKAYFLCKVGHTASAVNMPPNTDFWYADQCSHSVAGCKLRFDPDNRRTLPLPFGGFPGTLYIPPIE